MLLQQAANRVISKVYLADAAGKSSSLAPSPSPAEPAGGNVDVADFRRGGNYEKQKVAMTGKSPATLESRRASSKHSYCNSDYY